MELLIAFLAFFGIAGWSDATITQEKLEKAKAELTILQAKAAQADTLKAQNETLRGENESLRAAIEKFDQANSELKLQNEQLLGSVEKWRNDAKNTFDAWRNRESEHLKEVEGLQNQNETLTGERDAAVDYLRELRVTIETLGAENETLHKDNEALFNLAQMAGPLAVKIQEKEKSIKYLNERVKSLELRVEEADIIYVYWREKAEGRRQISVKLSDELYDLQERLIAAKNESDFKNKLFVGLMLLFFGAVALVVLTRQKLESAYKQYEDLKRQIESTHYIPEPGPSRGDVPPVI